MNSDHLIQKVGVGEYISLMGVFVQKEKVAFLVSIHMQSCTSK